MSFKRTKDDLRQLQALPLPIKVELTKRRIQEWISKYGTEGVYVSFSGGKDSTVLLHIVRSMEEEKAARAQEFGFTPPAPIPAVFVNTGLEYPEIQKFAMSHPHVVTIRPKMRFDQVLKKYGYPIIGKKQARYIRDLQNANESNQATVNLRLTGINIAGKYCPTMKLADKWVPLKDAPFRISEKCCDVMKKQPFAEYHKQTGRYPIMATMAGESNLREKAWLMNGCNAFDGDHPKSAPMSFWTEQDVLHYLKENNVPYCSVYGEIQIKHQDGDDPRQINVIDYLGCYEPEDQLETTGCSRTGCIFCMFGCHLEKEPNRFQQLRETHPRQYAYCIGGGEMIDGRWQPTKQGLGCGKVLDYIGVNYE